MKRKYILFSIVGVFIASYLFVAIQGSLTYKDLPPMKITGADSTKSFAIKLIGSQEFFTGDFNMRYIDVGKQLVEIKMRNDFIGDDSIKENEYIIKAVNKGSEWDILEYKVHWKCKSHIIFDFWTTGNC